LTEGVNVTNGHIAVVTAISADGKTVTIKDANFYNDGSVDERQVSIDKIY
jgi:surface antigen